MIPLLWIAVVTVVALVVWLVTRQRHSHEPDALDDARRILAERYARGDQSTDEYRERLDQLQTQPHELPEGPR